MFERLKKLIFDESSELEQDETMPIKRAPMDSLEDNANLRKTRLPERNEPFLKAEPIKSVPEANSGGFKRIDIGMPTQSVQPTRQEKTLSTTKLTQETEVVSFTKTNSIPTSVNNSNLSNTQFKRPLEQMKPAVKNANPQYYKPKEVISPIFGVKQENAPMATQSMKKILSKPITGPEEDDKILSPMYGVVTEDNINVPRSRVRRAKKNNVVNMSLEEMLNFEPKEDDLDYTLFDVKVDKDEFVSRENKIVDDVKKQL